MNSPDAVDFTTERRVTSATFDTVTGVTTNPDNDCDFFVVGKNGNLLLWSLEHHVGPPTQLFRNVSNLEQFFPC